MLQCGHLRLIDKYDLYEHFYFPLQKIVGGAYKSGVLNIFGNSGMYLAGAKAKTVLWYWENIQYVIYLYDAMHSQ